MKYFPVRLRIATCHHLFRFRLHEAIGPGLLHEITAIAGSTTATAVAGFGFGLLVKALFCGCKFFLKSPLRDSGLLEVGQQLIDQRRLTAKNRMRLA
jgi:hypothetical protein